MIFADRNPKKTPGSRRLGFECRPGLDLGKWSFEMITALRPWPVVSSKNSMESCTDFSLNICMIWFQKGLLTMIYIHLQYRILTILATMFYAYKSLETFLSHFQSILRVTHTHTHTQSPQIRGLGRDRLDVNLWEMC